MLVLLSQKFVWIEPFKLRLGREIQDRNLDQTTDTSNCIPTTQEVGPGIIGTIDVHTRIIVYTRLKDPSKDLAEEGLGQVRYYDQWVEEKDEVLVIRVKVESVGGCE